MQVASRACPPIKAQIFLHNGWLRLAHMTVTLIPFGKTGHARGAPTARCPYCAAPPHSHSSLLATLSGSKDPSLWLSLSFLAFVFLVFFAVLALALDFV